MLVMRCRPLIAAIVGIGKFSTSENVLRSKCTNCRTCICGGLRIEGGVEGGSESDFIYGLTWSGFIAARSFKSAPAQNDFSKPLFSTTTRQFASNLTSLMTSANSCII